MSDEQRFDMWLELTDNLTKAGNTFDGHATHGSIAEQLRVIHEFLGKYYSDSNEDEGIYDRGIYGQYKNS